MSGAWGRRWNVVGGLSLGVAIVLAVVLAYDRGFDTGLASVDVNLPCPVLRDSIRAAISHQHQVDRDLFGGFAKGYRFFFGLVAGKIIKKTCCINNTAPRSRATLVAASHRGGGETHTCLQSRNAPWRGSGGTCA